MTIAINNTNIKTGARFYPCDQCDREQHPSVTTLLDVMGSEVLMGWSAKHGTAKLLEYEKWIGSNDPILCSKGRSMFLDDFWKSGKQQAKEAAEIGTITHALIEAHLNKIAMTWVNPPEPAQNAFSAFLTWYNENKIKVVQTEKTFYNCQLNYAGTCDAILELNGELTLVDWKTGSGIYSSHPIQVWAYALADEMQGGNRLYKQIGIGNFRKDGTSEVKIFKRTDWPGIEEARQIMTACEKIFNFNQKWDICFPYQRKKKTNNLKEPTKP